MAEDTLDLGLRSIESVLRSKKTEKALAEKGVESDDDIYEEKINDQFCETSSIHVLDPPCIRMKGLTNARIKSQLHKNAKKARNLKPMDTHQGNTRNSINFELFKSFNFS